MITRYWDRHPGRIVDRFTGHEISNANKWNSTKEWNEGLIKEIQKTHSEIHGHANVIFVDFGVKHLLKDIEGYEAIISNPQEEKEFLPNHELCGAFSKDENLPKVFSSILVKSYTLLFCRKNKDYSSDIRINSDLPTVLAKIEIITRLLEGK